MSNYKERSNIILDKFKINSNKYSDINSIFNIYGISEDFFLISEKNKRNRVYIYKIEPITIFNVDKNFTNEIIEKYKEFLLSIQMDIQIYIENSKIDIEDYFSGVTFNISDNKRRYIECTKQYINDNFTNNGAYITNYYMLALCKSEDEIINFNKNIYILEEIGLMVNKLNTKDEIIKFLYSSINKVNLYE